MPEALHYEPWTRAIGMASNSGHCPVGSVGSVRAVITLCPVFSAAASLQWPSFLKLTDETDAYPAVTAVMNFAEHENQAETYSC